jgi:LPS-assembly protein
MSLNFRKITGPVIIFLAVVLFFPAAKSAPKKGLPALYVDADQYSSSPNQTATLVGNVKVIRDTQQMTCDKAYINFATNEVTAEGNVVFISPKEYIKAERFSYNFTTEKGIIHNGFIQRSQETIEGEEILKTGESEFEARSASYTSCVNCPASWKLTGSKIDATVGSYAYISNPIIRIFGVPILWLPYVVIPIKNERQTGLLAPSYGISSKDGFSLSGSFFWAIDQSHDATLTETSFANRGFKTGLEYRFVTDKNSAGLFRGNFINDKSFGSDTAYTKPDTRYDNVPGAVDVARPGEPSIARYGFHYEHHFELPENYMNNVNLNLIRDSRYIIDFPKDLTGIGDPALENRISLSKNTEDTHWSADVSFYQNLLRADPVGQNEDAVHRVPEIKISRMPEEILGTGILGNFDFNYSNFGRAGRGYDEINGVDGFQDAQYTYSTTTGLKTDVLRGDAYRTGQRLIFRPQIAYPFTLGEYFDILPRIEYFEKYYQFGYSPRPTASTRYLRATVEGKTKLSSVIGNLEDPRSRRFKHEVEPSITYTFVPYFYQDAHPFFGPLNEPNAQPFLPHFRAALPITEYDNLQFDYRDRLVDRNLVTFGLTNKLVRKVVKGNSAEYREIIRHRLTESYDVWTQIEPRKNAAGQLLDESKEPWSEIRSLLDVKLEFLNITSDVSYYPYQDIASSSTGVTLNNAKGDRLSLTYTQSLALSQDENTGVLTLNKRTRSEVAALSTYFTSPLMDLAGSVSYDMLNNSFTSYRARGLLKLPGKCWGITGDYEQLVKGEQPRFEAMVVFFFGEGQKFGLSGPM